ncbi:PWI domain [Sesbania bispinosa]|nr:PWI domain [Sesbania bispinosa]
MSGGFFRGTSADQDTRFSNKQAKLLKSQKFAPELDHLVNMTKVNMEVIKPWITRRVTELLGFEDEVLINFIHGLLDAKEVNGKEVQIQITGFMEKNTGKFMKELWTLLLSAQKNASGVPQQFLDAKEEEIRKKKVENDRITSEIQRKKDKEDRENMQERLKKLDGGFDVKNTDTASDPTLKLSDSANYIQDGKESDKRNGARTTSRLFSRSSHSPAVSISPHRRSPSRSLSKSFSNSRSYSSGRHRSRSISGSPEARGRSFSSERIRRCSPQRRSISPPPRRYSPRRSPLHRGLTYSRRRSRSRSNYRSPSPVRRRMLSPFHRSSPSFRRRRTPSPIRRRGSPSPVRRHRSPSPVRRRRSPSPWRRRSPVMRRRSPSPVRRGPPIHVRRRSRSPSQSPSPILRRYGNRTQRNRSLSPLQRRSPVSGNKRLPSSSPRRSHSPEERSSQSPVRHVSPSPVRRNSPRRRRTPVQSSRGRVRMQERLSPEAHQPSSPLRSVQRDKNRNSSHYKLQDSISMPEKSPIQSVSPQARNRTGSDDRSPLESPRKQRGEKLISERGEKLISERSLSPNEKPGTRKPSQYSTEANEEVKETYYSRESRDSKSNSSRNKSKYSPPVRKRNDSPAKFHHEEECSPERTAGHLDSEYRGYDDNIDRNKKDREIKSYKSSGKGDETTAQQKSPVNKELFSSKKAHKSCAVDIKTSVNKVHSHSNHDKDNNRHRKLDTTQNKVGKVDSINQSASNDSSSEEGDKHRREGKDRRKHRRSDRKSVTSDEDYSYDSELEDRKEAKRRKKEERKLRKEEKRRRREERRRRREDRHAEKLKMKSKTDDYISDVKEAERIEPHQRDNEDAVSEQKKLEIELRNKALESLKAKRGMNH